jgi:hypothetical protein
MKVRDSDLRIILVRVASPPAIITATTRFLSDHVIFSLSERSTERCLKKNDDGDTTRDFKSNFDDKFPFGRVNSSWGYLLVVPAS